jgi:hypothetical protein
MKTCQTPPARQHLPTFSHLKSHPICHLIYRLKSYPLALRLLALDRGVFATDQGMLAHYRCDMVTLFLGRHTMMACMCALGKSIPAVIQAARDYLHNLDDSGSAHQRRIVDGPGQSAET